MFDASCCESGACICAVFVTHSENVATGTGEAVLPAEISLEVSPPGRLCASFPFPSFSFLNLNLHPGHVHFHVCKGLFWFSTNC